MMNWSDKGTLKTIAGVGLKYGIAGGGIAIILFFSLYKLHENPLSSIRLFDFFLIPLFVIFALYEVKRYVLGGYLSYSQGMATGAVCFLAIAIISAIFILFFLNFVDDQLLAQYQQEGLSILQNNSSELDWTKVGATEHKEAVQNVREATAYQVALDDLLKKSVIGLFLTSLFTVFIKNKRPQNP